MRAMLLRASLEGRTLLLCVKSSKLHLQNVLIDGLIQQRTVRFVNTERSGVTSHGTNIDSFVDNLFLSRQAMSRARAAAKAVRAAACSKPVTPWHKPKPLRLNAQGRRNAAQQAALECAAEAGYSISRI